MKIDHMERTRKCYGRTDGQMRGIPITPFQLRGGGLINMFAKFDEIPAMTLQDIKETLLKDGRAVGQGENSIPPASKFAGGGGG